MVASGSVVTVNPFDGVAAVCSPGASTAGTGATGCKVHLPRANMTARHPLEGRLRTGCNAGCHRHRPKRPVRGGLKASPCVHFIVSPLVNYNINIKMYPMPGSYGQTATHTIGTPRHPMYLSGHRHLPVGQVYRPGFVPAVWQNSPGFSAFTGVYGSPRPHPGRDGAQPRCYRLRPRPLCWPGIPASR